jgi:hypothetical protein
MITRRGTRVALLLAVLLGVLVWAGSTAEATTSSQPQGASQVHCYPAVTAEIQLTVGQPKYGEDKKPYPGKDCKPAPGHRCRSGQIYDRSAYKCRPIHRKPTYPPTYTTPPASTTTSMPTSTTPPVTTSPAAPTTTTALSPVTVVQPGTTSTVTQIVAVAPANDTLGGGSAGVPEVARVPVGAAQTGGGATAGIQQNVWFVLGAALIMAAGLLTFFGTRRHTDGGAKA